MSASDRRTPQGGLIDRARPLAFRFDGADYRGLAGDTLASALLANGVRLVARSLKYHRPRGIFSAGSEEPCALVQIGRGAAAEPNTRATCVELFEGLEAHSQNHWPALRFDVGALLGACAPLLPAGFYNKTFMWPRRRWMLYERYIRSAAGHGRAPRAPDPDRYEHRYAHCDVLVAGAGPAGLAAALAAARAGARVILADEDARFGGTLLGERALLDGAPAIEWVSRIEAELTGQPEVTLLRRATVCGYYDHNLIAIAERVSDHLPAPVPGAPRQRLWKVRARQVVLATGAMERPLVFANNDRPGVMIASAARTYAVRYGVRAGRRAVIFTNNDSAYGAALDLAAAGVEVAMVVDARRSAEGALAGRVREAGIAVETGAAVADVHGRGGVESVDVIPLAEGGRRYAGPRQRLPCDLLCVSGGWSPSVHLHAQSGARPVYDPRQACFVPGEAVQAERSAGAAAGRFPLSACLADGAEAGARAASGAGLGGAAGSVGIPACERPEEAPILPLWRLPQAPRGRGKRFVDLQNDVSVEDLELAAREGYRSVEHLKRYTTLGMGTDQGKTSNVNGLAILAEERGEEIPAVGTTTFRPPYTPVTLGTLAGRGHGALLDPVRRSPLHAWHERAGAVFMPAGQWQRPRYYPRRHERMAEAVAREVRAVRDGVGLVDVSTLGKIELRGPDALELLERVYVNGWRSLEVGRARYGVMLREDGLVFDDGTCTRIGETRYLMTTTTAHAPRVMAHLEFHLQMVWPELRVYLTPVTDRWAAMALAGPGSREVLARVAEEVDLAAGAFPFMGYREGRVAGVPARLFRISFSGELAWEINVPADCAAPVWEALLAAGEEAGIAPYGVEAMDVLRIEKGHLVVGADIDGRTAPADLGFGRLLSTRKDFIGRRALARSGFGDGERLQLVGLLADDGRTPIAPGAQLVEGSARTPAVGRVTSTAWSPTLDAPIALALLAGGASRHGDVLHAVAPLAGAGTQVRVTAPVFVDPEGARLRM